MFIMDMYKEVLNLGHNNAYWIENNNKIYGSVIGSKTGKTAGEIIEESKMGIGVTTGDGEIIFTDIKPFGKKRMNAYSYINGLHNSLIGKVFE